MATIVKQNVGIDQSKDCFKAAFGTLDSEQRSKVKSSKRFDNNQSCFKRLVEWTDKLNLAGTPLWFTIETTGVYYEGLTYFLHEGGRQ
ncbi:MAG: transposase [Saprospiraceae bacterium]|nr:transposase [Saprospiraceae bacterium]MCF8250389.1 transposase [Saprospiraceae bacterium]MCF8281541.1 transposase [Bacteroidales bacterium]MCF8312236.1 transposase [Saprospiraceae bacterium]MCF8440577.1 transposase [Saprospiraceae bacterium]